MLKTKIQTLATATSPNFKMAMGDGYTTVSIGPDHNKQLMFKTSDLDEFVTLVNAGNILWSRAKDTEKRANEPADQA